MAGRTTSPRRGAAHAPHAAFVLHHYDWSESSQIVELFTRDLGRVVAVAKGAKRPHSQLRAVLLPLQPISVLLSQRKVDSKAEDQAEVHLLRGAEWAGGAALPAGSALMSGFYLNELLLRALARHDPHPELWDAYAATLPLLAAGDETSAATTATVSPLMAATTPDIRFVSDVGGRLAAALRAFELFLLRTTGLLPEFDRVTLTQERVDVHDPQACYQLRAEAGLVDARHLGHGEPYESPGDSATGLIASLCLAIEAALQAGDIVALQTACQGAPGELKQQLRRTLHYHFGDRTLRTRQVMQGIRQLLGG